MEIILIIITIIICITIVSLIVGNKQISKGEKPHGIGYVAYLFAKVSTLICPVTDKERKEAAEYLEKITEKNHL